MRTTVTIDDDVLDAVKELADSSGQAIGAVLSDLARSALPSKPKSKRYRRKNNLAVFQVSPKAETIPGDRAAKLLAEEVT
jgi:hypothetical protein